MNKEELIIKLQSIENDWSKEENHIKADKLLLEYINSPEVTEAFNKIEKWYN